MWLTSRGDSKMIPTSSYTIFVHRRTARNNNHKTGFSFDRGPYHFCVGLFRITIYPNPSWLYAKHNRKTANRVPSNQIRIKLRHKQNNQSEVDS